MWVYNVIAYIRMPTSEWQVGDGIYGWDYIKDTLLATFFTVEQATKSTQKEVQTNKTTVTQKECTVCVQFVSRLTLIKVTLNQ